MDVGSKLKALIPNSQFAAGKKELVLRCPYCGHTSSAGKKHMYIGLSKDKPYMFNCFKCEAGGLVNRVFLDLLNIHDQELIQYIELHNKSMRKARGNHYSANHIRQPQVAYDAFEVNYDVYPDKVKYINGRLGSNLSVSEMMNMKIIFDFSFFKRQIMSYLGATESDFERIQRDYVGFLSVNNTSLSMRCIREVDSKYRYLICKLDDRDIYNKAFCIPSFIPYTSQRIPVYITEGQFDILSVYTNITKGSTGIYFAAAGNKYSAVLRYILSRGIMNMDIHLYFDNDSAGDIAKRQIEYFIKNNIIFFRGCQVFTHVNKKDKDFGVPLERIDDYCIKIL